jgi:hypothetical protein
VAEDTGPEFKLQYCKKKKKSKIVSILGFVGYMNSVTATITESSHKQCVNETVWLVYLKTPKFEFHIIQIPQNLFLPPKHLKNLTTTLASHPYKIGSQAIVSTPLP